MASRRADPDLVEYLGRILLRHRLRIGAFLGILLLGTLATLNTTIAPGGDPANARRMGAPEALYHTLKLFLVQAEGLSGNDLAGYVLWAIYFIAPAVSVGLVAQALEAVIHSPARQIRRLRGHVIVAGMGRLGSAALESFRAKGRPVVAIDRDHDNEIIAHLRVEHQPYVLGDLTSTAILDRANVAQARQFLAVSGDDMANIDGATLAKRLSGGACDSVAQITDPFLLTNVQGLLEEHGIRVFNPYEVAARQVAVRVREKLATRTGRTAVVVAGFGKFGKMVARELLTANGTKGRRDPVDLLVVDRLPGMDREWRSFAVMHGLPRDGLRTMVADVRDPEFWERMAAELRHEFSVVVIATDNDSSNVTTALLVQRHLEGEVFLITRLFRSVAAVEKDVHGIGSLVFSEVALEALMAEADQAK